MASIFGFDLGINLPALTSGGWSLGLIFGLLLIGLIFIIGIVVIMIIISKRTFNKEIVVFENISGQGYQKTMKDRARVVKIGDGGEEILYLKNKKVYRTAYGRKMGKNAYWFAIGQDGYWYNIVLGDLDAKMGMLDVEPIDRDMRYMHVAIRKNITDRYQKKKMEKIVAYTIVGVVIVALIIVIGGYFMAKQMVEASKLTAQNIEAVKPLADTLGRAVAHLDTLCGGSGITPA